MAYLRDIDTSIDKVPPQSLEAEQAVLGAIILDGESIAKAIELITPQDFYKESHRKIIRQCYRF